MEGYGSSNKGAAAAGAKFVVFPTLRLLCRCISALLVTTATANDSGCHWCCEKPDLYKLSSSEAQLLLAQGPHVLKNCRAD